MTSYVAQNSSNTHWVGVSCFGAQALGLLGFSSCGVWAQWVQLRSSSAPAQLLWGMGLVGAWHVESSWTRDQTCVSCIGRQRQILTTEPSGKTYIDFCILILNPVQFSSVAQSCLTLCDPMNHSMPGLPVHYQLPEFTQTHVHRVGDTI